MAAAAAAAGSSARALLDARAAEVATALLAIGLYLPTIGFGFVFDDASLIAPDGSPVAVGGALPYRPLRFASYLLDSWLGGTPAIYHAHNVLLHALVAALVVALARRLGSARTAALAGGVLVAVHPLAVEAAAYVAGRRDLLCAVFGLAAVLAHLSGRLVTAMVLVVASTAAKESGLVFLAPLMAATIAGLDGQGERPGGRHGAAAGECDDTASTRATVQPARNRATQSQSRATIAMVSIALAGACALAMTLAYGAIGPWAPASGAVGLALPGRMAAHYLGALVGLRTLGPEYPQLLHFVDRVQGGDAAAMLAATGATLVLALAAAAALAACVRSGRSGRGRQTAFVSAWTMAVMVALSLWGGLHEPGADRHGYLLLAPVGLALAVAMSQLLRLGESVEAMDARRRDPEVDGQSRVAAIDPQRRVAAPAMLRGATAAVVTIALLASASASRAQMQIWQSERTLWTHASANASASPRAHANMARSLAADGRYREAARRMNSALAAEPGNFLLHVGRAALRCAQGRHFLARRDLKSAGQLGAPAPMLAELTRDCGFAAT